jgi:multidrug transporter EmrE-like cation transporter
MSVGYLSVFFTILFTSIGQLLLKWRLGHIGLLPQGIVQKAIYFVKLIFTDIYVFSGFVFAFLASLFWLNALNKLELNIAYPMMSLSFLIVFVFSSIFIHEKVYLLQAVGLSFILIGVCMIGYVGAK